MIVETIGDMAGEDIASRLCDTDTNDSELHDAQLDAFAFGLVVLQACRDAGLQPDFYAGQGAAAYAALVAANVLGLEESVRLVLARRDAIRVASQSRPGATARIDGLDEDELEAVCALTDRRVWVSAYRGPASVWVGGEREDVAHVCQIALDRGARSAHVLSTTAAYNTPLMAPARDLLLPALSTVRFSEARRPVVANCDGRPHQKREAWTDLLAAEVCNPLRWRQGIHRLATLGVDTFLDLGSTDGKEFASAAGTSSRALTIEAPGDVESAAAAVTSARHALSIGEGLDVAERLVVSHVTGVFMPLPAQLVTTEGEIVRKGDTIARVAGEPLTSPFTGWLMGLLALPGERVRQGQPIAWLRSI
ncbi:MAG: acyltransferase domain-containing protein [Actinobacteria bacterium]|nr:acyltransferase domain-containing protein [Actinomycetota bacterium]